MAYSVEETGVYEAQQAAEQRESDVRMFHRKLVDFFCTLNSRCDWAKRRFQKVPGRRKNTCPAGPVITCSPAHSGCKLFDKGFFPKIIDQKFVDDVLDNALNPKDINKVSAERFHRGVERKKREIIRNEAVRKSQQDRNSDTEIIDLSDSIVGVD